MKKNVVILSLVFLLTIFTQIQQRAAAQDQESRFIKKGQEFVMLLSENKFDEAMTWFDDDIKSKMTSSDLKKTWRLILEEAGPMETISAVNTKSKDNMRAVVLTTRFTKGEIDIKIVFNNKEQISGLWFTPCEE